MGGYQRSLSLNPTTVMVVLLLGLWLLLGCDNMRYVSAQIACDSISHLNLNINYDCIKVELSKEIALAVAEQTTWVKEAKSKTILGVHLHLEHSNMQLSYANLILLHYYISTVENNNNTFLDTLLGCSILHL